MVKPENFIGMIIENNDYFSAFPKEVVYEKNKRFFGCGRLVK